MRFYLGHRLPLGFWGGVRFGGFHHSRVLIAPPGSAQPGPVERGLGIGIELAILAALIAIYLSFH
jgi:hypothetical protein